MAPKKVIETINNFLAEISGWLLIIIMFLLITDFISRAFSKPIQGLSSLSVFALVAAVYFGIPHCEEIKGHVKVEILVSKLPIKFRRFLTLLSYWIAIGIIFICIWSIGSNAIDSFISKEKVAGTLPLIIYPAKFTVVIGFVFYFFQLFINMIEEYKSSSK